MTIDIKDRRLIGGAAVASIILLAAATIGGKDSRADVFVASLGALGQVWIAAMLWHLAKEQFDFTKAATEREDRTSNYERRSAVQGEWTTASRGIGFTGVEESNVDTLYGLLNRIEHLFGPGERAQAKEACDAARAARKRLRELAAAGGVHQQDAEYRGHIERFQIAKKAIYDALRAKTGIMTE